MAKGLYIPFLLSLFMAKLKPIIPEDADPIELADKMKWSVFKGSLKRLVELDKLIKSH